jgi:hypothetical protein
MISRDQDLTSLLRNASLAVLSLALGACATWQAPTDTSDAPLRARAVSEQKGGVGLSAAVLGPEDSLRMLGKDLTRAGVQPVWIEVRNDTDQFLWLLRAGTDPDYFSPLEVAWSAHVTLGGKTNEHIDEHFNELAFPNPIPARGASSGLLFTNAEPVTKLLNVDLLGDRSVVPFTLLLPVPGDAAGGRDVIHRYDEGEIVDYDDLDELRAALEALPCCADSTDGREGGDPINVVLIGRLDDIAAVGGRRGYRRSAEAAGAPQLLFGRSPDFVTRKLAQAGAPANWLRLWRAPLSFQGQLVLVAQAGRPVGGRFAPERPGDERLDADVDEARGLLIQDMMYSGGLDKLAFVSGVGAVPQAQPRATAGGGSYYTDGRRAVLFFTTQPLAFSDAQVLDWEPVLQEKTAEAKQEHAGGKK